MSDKYSRSSGERYSSSSPSRSNGISISSSSNVTNLKPKPPPGNIQLQSGGKKGQMQNLLGEFKGLYEGKLKRLDEAEKAGEETSKVCQQYNLDERQISLQLQPLTTLTNNNNQPKLLLKLKHGTL